MVVGVEADSPAAAAKPSASTAGGKAPGKRGPASQKEQAEALERLIEPGIGLLTDLLEWRLQAPGLAMTETEAAAIARPAARLSAPALSKSKVGKRLLKFAGESEDAIALITALGIYVERVAPIAADRIAANREMSRARRVANDAARNGKVPTQHATRPTPAPAGRHPTNAANASGSAASPAPATNGTAAAGIVGVPVVGIDAAYEPAPSGIIEIYPGGIRPLGT